MKVPGSRFRSLGILPDGVGRGGAGGGLKRRIDLNKVKLNLNNMKNRS